MTFMYKKYYSTSIFILILFFISRVYLQSEHVKSAYHKQKLTTQLEKYFKEKQSLSTELLTLQSPDTIKNNVSNKLKLIPLQLKQIHTLAAVGHNE